MGRTLCGTSLACVLRIIELAFMVKDELGKLPVFFFFFFFFFFSIQVGLKVCLMHAEVNT